eukprot:scaffold58753_cov35-Tisochrysis_lutea.AAC.3
MRLAFGVSLPVCVVSQVGSFVLCRDQLQKTDHLAEQEDVKNLTARGREIPPAPKTRAPEVASSATRGVAARQVGEGKGRSGGVVA